MPSATSKASVKICYTQLSPVSDALGNTSGAKFYKPEGPLSTSDDTGMGGADSEAHMKGEENGSNISFIRGRWPLKEVGREMI